MASSGEVADVVVGEIGRRQAHALATRGAVEGRRDAEASTDFAQTGS